MRLWGGRFNEDQSDLMKQFNASFMFDQRLYAGDIQGSLVYAEALHLIGLITSGERDSIQKGLKKIEAEFDAGQFEAKASDEDIHTAVERRLSELIGEIAGKLHTGRSRNDQVAVDLRLYVMQEIGPDIIIAVDISSPYADPEAIDSFLGVTDQVLRIMTRNNTDREILHIGPQDILITPELEDMSAADFAGAGEAVRIGEESTRQSIPVLRHLSVSESEYAEYLEVFEKDLSRIFGLGEFDKVGYLVENGALGSTIRIKPYGKSWGPNYIRFGMTLFDDFQGNSNYSLSINHTRTQLNRLGAEWRNDFKLGINKGISSEFYQPLDYAGRYFIAPEYRYDETFSFEFFGDISGKYQIKIAQFRLGAGMQFGRFGQIMAGVAGANARIKPIIGPNNLPEFKIRDGWLYTTFLWDQIDNTNFPKRGESLEMVYVSTKDFMDSDWIYDLLRIGVLKPVSTDSNTVWFSTGRLEEFRIQLWEMPFIWVVHWKWVMVGTIIMM